MNWNKAKNILIVAFALLNLFLAYVLITLNNTQNNNVTLEYKNMVVELLEEHNVLLNIELPQGNINIPEITVKYEIYNPNDVRYENFEIPEHNKSLSYTNNSDTKLYEDIDKDLAEKISLEFINQNGFDNGDIKLWSRSLENNTYRIEYKQQYNDITFDDGFMIIYVNQTGVTRFERRWLTIESIEDKNQMVIEPYRALMLAMDKLPSESDEITEMLLTYKLSLNRAIDTQWYNIDHGTMSPYWKIRFQNSESIDIKASQ